MQAATMNGRARTWEFEMFLINELPPQVDPALVALLEQAEPATIGHFLDFGFVDPAIRAQWPVPRIAGTAVTVRCAGTDSTIVHYALGQLRPGDVLVIDRAGDSRHAAVGGGVAFAARAAGARGIVIDGVATDISEIRDYKVPVWARGLSTVTTKRLFQQGEFCVPVSIGGVAVQPGDAILADENGVLVLHPAAVGDAARRAIKMQADEGPRLAEVAKGARLPELNGTNARLKEILELQKKARS
jgi:4-hydroxy-4-methyl-2-oxoglutarate aldolase